MTHDYGVNLHKHNVPATFENPIVINFNWSAWDEGRKMVSNPKFDFNNIDIPTKCKLITAIFRSDRFHDGALIDAFESGLMLSILTSIRAQLESKSIAS